MTNVDALLVAAPANTALTLLEIMESQYLSFPADCINDASFIATVYDKNPRAAKLLSDYNEYTAILCAAQHYLGEVLEQIEAASKREGEGEAECKGAKN